MTKSISLCLTFLMALLLVGPGCKPKKTLPGANGSDSLINRSDLPDDGGILDPTQLGDGGFMPPTGRLPEGTRIREDVLFASVLFAYDSANLAAAERAKVEAVAAYLNDDPTAGVIVEGHCDERGSREYNLALGERRALSIRQYISGLGVDGGRIQTKSYGEEMPVAMGHDAGSWTQNRRGEFKIYDN